MIRKILLSAVAGSLMLLSCQNPSVDQNVTSEENRGEVSFKDYGGEPLVINIEDYTLENDLFRRALWTGDLFQLTVMSIPVGGEVGLEMHDDVEQFLRVEAGEARVMMGDSEDNLDFVVDASDDDIILVPLGKWHNVINVGTEPLKLYSIYAKPEHAFGTIHKDKAESDADHHH